MQSWTDEKVAAAIRVLESSKSIEQAAKKLRTTPGALRAGFQRARERGVAVGTPVEHLRTVTATFTFDDAKIDRIFSAAPRIERVLVCPDIHIPFHDHTAWNTFLAAARSYKPDRLVFLGDGADCYEISEFTKDPARKHTFASEMEAVNNEFDRVCQLGIKRVDYLLGNHEDRLNRLIAKRAPELYGLTSVPQLLKFKERGWNWHEYGEQIQIGKIFLAHDYGPAGGRAVSQALAATGHSVLFGHTHRAQTEYSGNTDGTRHIGMSCGWLGDYNSLAFAYARRWKAKKDWTHAFATLEVDTDTGHGYAQLHPILEGKAMVDGQLVAA